MDTEIKEHLALLFSSITVILIMLQLSGGTDMIIEFLKVALTLASVVVAGVFVFLGWYLILEYIEDRRCK